MMVSAADHVQHAQWVALRAHVSLVDDAVRSWVQMAHEGEFRGHSQGTFAFTRETFAQIVENFDRQKNPVPVTYEHPQYRGDGQPIPAAGWVVELAVRDEPDGPELWGLVEWTERAAAMIRSGEYRYCSVVVAFDSLDRETGEDIGAELIELGLTNVPFLDGMEPIRLRRMNAAADVVSRRARRAGRKEMSMDPNKVLMTIARALGLPEDTAPEKLKAAVEAFIAFIAATAKDAEEAAETVEEMAASRKALERAQRLARRVSLADVSEQDYAAAMEIASKLMDATGLDAAALLAAVTEKLDALAALLLAGPDSGGADAEVAGELPMSRLRAELSALRARDSEASRRLAELSREVEELRGKERAAAEAAREARIAALLDDAIESGRMLEAEREHVARFARADFDAAKAMLAARVPVVPQGRVQIGAQKSDASAEPRDAAEQALVRNLRAMGLSREAQASALAKHRERVASMGR